MLETRFDRVAFLIGILATLFIFISISYEIIGEIDELSYRRNNYKYITVLLFSIMNGVGLCWGVRWLGRGWIPPIVYSSASTFISIFYINSYYSNINWLGDNAIEIFLCYIFSFIGSIIFLYTIASILDWISKGK